MLRTKWIFGPQQSQAGSGNSNSVAIPTISSADAKKFGLENFGNTCYANSVIQALYFCAPFRDLLIQSEDHSVSQIPLEQPAQQSPPSQPLVPVRKRPERKPSTSGSTADVPNGVEKPAQTIPSIPSSPHSLFSALRSLFVHISSHPADKGTLAPRAFIDKLKEINDVFRSTQHQDAHEFLNYLLNRIVEEIEEDRNLNRHSTTATEDLSNSITTLTSKTPATSSSSTSGTSSRDNTLVHKLFEGTLTSETRCLTCETISSRDESFLDLSIDIEQNSSVTACLRQFSASEMLCQKNKFFCDSCCDLQEAEKRMKIKKLPNVLALHLKRFKYQEELQKYIKLAYRVAFPFELRLFNTVDDTDNADRLFNLFGIVVHIGNGPHHGHYISIIKTQGSWQVFDDENVYPIAEGDIPKYFGESNSGSAYVLYYQAADIDLPSLGLRNPEPADFPSQQSLPVHPPGLVDEGDSSDLSDPPFPITPSHSSSPLLSFTDKPRHIEVNVSNLDEPAPSGTAFASPLPLTPTPTSTTKTKQSLFNSLSSLRRTPSASARLNPSGPDSTETEPPPPLPPPPNLPPLPPPSPTNGKVKDPERKASGWFGKRKSLRLGDKKSASESNDPPASPFTSMTETNEISFSSSNNRVRSTNPSMKDKRRRPSEPTMFDPVGFANLSSPRPKSTMVDTLAVRVDVNGIDSPSPGSASSSLRSAHDHAGSSGSAGAVEFPPARKSSLEPKHPEHKKSLSSLPKERSSIPQPVRPSTATGAKAADLPGVRPLPLPPVPPLPASLGQPIPPPRLLFDEPDDFVVLEKGKSRTSTDETSSTAFPVSASPSAASSNSNAKRATRKLSMTTMASPILGGLGFGKKDKKEKEKESGKGPPSSFSGFARF